MASTWHTVATKDVRLLQYQLSQVFALPKEYTFLNYLRCHDDIGWGLDYGFLSRFGMGEVPHKKFLNDCLTGRLPGSPSRGELYNDDPRLGDARLCGTTASLCGVEAARYEKDDEKLAWALRLDISLHAYMFTLSGIPVLYSGDEIAQENDYSYHNDPDKAADSRYLHRGNMNWEAAKLRHDPATPEGQIFTALRALETLRDAHRVFDSRADVWLLRTGDNAVLGIGRYLLILHRGVDVHPASRANHELSHRLVVDVQEDVALQRISSEVVHAIHAGLFVSRDEGFQRTVLDVVALHDGHDGCHADAVVTAQRRTLRLHPVAVDVGLYGVSLEVMVTLVHLLRHHIHVSLQHSRLSILATRSSGLTHHDVLSPVLEGFDAMFLCPVEQELLHPCQVTAWARHLCQEIKVLPNNLRFEVFNCCCHSLL
jgi:hypothetical protein